ELPPRLAVGLPFEVAQQQRHAVFLGQPAQLLVEDGGEIPPRRLGRGVAEGGEGHQIEVGGPEGRAGGGGGPGGGGGGPGRAAAARAWEATRQATRCSQAASASRRPMDAALRARVRKVAWKESSASWAFRSSRRHTPRTMRWCRQTSNSKAASSRRRTKRS